MQTLESKGIFVHYNCKRKSLHIIGYSKVCSGKYTAFNTYIVKKKRKKSVLTQEALNEIIPDI